MAIIRSRAFSLISALVITSVVSIVVMSCGGDDSKKDTPAPSNTTTVKYTEVSSFIATSCATSNCHSSTSQAGGYNMSTRAGIAKEASESVTRIENGTMPSPGAEKTAFDADTAKKAKLLEWLKAGAPE